MDIIEEMIMYCYINNIDYILLLLPITRNYDKYIKNIHRNN